MIIMIIIIIIIIELEAVILEDIVIFLNLNPNWSFILTLIFSLSMFVIIIS